jgi:hypothetical protein
MATFVFTNGYVSINGQDHSNHVRGVTLEVNAELQDDTVMGDTTRSRTPGLLDWTLTVEYLQDFADNDIDEDLFALIGAAAFAIAVRPVNTTISASNPEYQGNAVLESYAPIQGTVGEMAGFTAVFRAAGALVRDITP